MKLNLDNYDKIIFDMDGVITSEEAYWQTAALSLYDLLFSHQHYGVSDIDREYCRKNYKEIYSIIMCGGRTVKAIKLLGINTNWDLLYGVFCVSKYLNPDLERLDPAHFQSVCMFLENIKQKAPDIYDGFAALANHGMPNLSIDDLKRGQSPLWDELFTTFNLWYNGCDEFKGIQEDEELLFDPKEVEDYLKALTKKGIVLGIGTGRPRSEIINPLTKFGLINYFDKDLIVTYDEVSNAEKTLNPSRPLAKPDPFVFLKSALGNVYTDRELHAGKYDKSRLKDTLIVGDAPSDLFAAKVGGFDFLGVLTGIDGEEMLTFFTENKANYIFNTIFEMLPQ